MRRTGRLISVLGSFGAAVVLFAAGVSPPDADSNVQRWLQHVGVHHPPPALATRAADHLLQGMALILLIVFLSFALDLWSHFRKRRNSAPPPVGAFHFDDHQGAPAPKDPRKEVGIGEALAYIVHREWGWTLDDAMAAVFEPGTMNVFNDHREAALNGDVTVWGRRNGFDIWRKIPKEYWEHHQLNGTALTQGHARTWGDDTDIYIDLMVNKAETERRWPK